jgi:hypothetical protein
MALKVECTTAYIGTAPVITVSGLDATYHIDVTWEFGSQSGTIATKTKQTRFDDYIWSPYFYNEIPNATSGVGLLIVEAYYGSTLKARAVTEFTVLVNTASSAPSIALPSVVDFNDTTIALTGDNSKLVRYRSTALLTVRATAHNGASIAEIVVTNGDKAADGSGENTFYFINVENERFNIKVTDTRGLVTSITYTVPAERIIEYTPLTCHIGNEKPDTDGKLELSCSGNYFNDMFTNNSNIGVMNELSVYCRYKARNGTFGDWQLMTITSISNGQYIAKITITGLDYRTKYIFECLAVDRVMNVSSGENTIVSIPVFHWSDNDFVFEVPVTFKQGASGVGDSTGGGEISDGTLEGDLNITGNLRLKGSGNYGNTLYFGDSSYCYLQENTDDDLTIKASDLNLNVTNLMLNGAKIQTDIWTPTLTTSGAVSSYSTRVGWYIRFGNVVVVGFNIGASCNSGYSSTTLAISGLPFTPASNAFGGGVMFGAYVNAGFCFEAWAATTSGQITPRLQPCNNSSASNLQISSTAYYPSGSGTLTLGGTITYVTND